MRMWLVPPQIMCRAHLLGEHVEIHMFIGTINKGGRVSGYIAGGLLEFDSLESRHHDLVSEMLRRGYRHNSPLPEIYNTVENRKIDVQENIKELCNRCENCRKRYEEFYQRRIK